MSALLCRDVGLEDQKRDLMVRRGSREAREGFSGETKEGIKKRVFVGVKNNCVLTEY